jgi:hypothetical protein
VSDTPPSEAIFAELRKQAEQARRSKDADDARREKLAPLELAWKPVRELGLKFDADGKVTEESLAGWVARLADLAEFLAGRDLLGRLACPPEGVAGHPAQARLVAIEVLTTARTDRARAASLLRDAAALPPPAPPGVETFGDEVARWLRRGLASEVAAAAGLFPVRPAPSAPDLVGSTKPPSATHRLGEVVTSVQKTAAPANLLPPAPSPDPPNGTLRDNRVYVQGVPLRLTEQLRRLLAYLLTHNGASVEAVRQHIGYADRPHLEKRLKDLRDKLKKESRKSGLNISITTAEGLAKVTVTRQKQAPTN